MTMAEVRTGALSRARGGRSLANDEAVIRGFMARGFQAVDIAPRENVLTYRAWQAVGRQVRKGEHGVRLSTWIPVEKRDAATGEKRPDGIRPKVVTVFHVSQTDKVE